jgi:CBS domain-containing protein
MDRPEYKLKQRPLTCLPNISVFEAVSKMAEKSFGAVIVINDHKKVIGVVTERDVMNKLVAQNLDAHQTLVSDIMTEHPRVARETDDLIDWLRIMSNERFRRLPVVDDNGQIKAVFTQGDFVSYTWPDLIYQMKSIATATVSKNWAVLLIGGGIALYTVIMVIVLNMIN